MQYGVCKLSIVPMRAEPSDASELVSQMLYGEHFEILEQTPKWTKIRIAYDQYEGWIDPKQYVPIETSQFEDLQSQTPVFAGDLVEFISDSDDQLIPITLGATLNPLSLFKHQYEGQKVTGTHAKENLIKTAYMFLHAPYLWGGKTNFGIDCSGFTQMVYKINGYKLLRDASQQVSLGTTLNLIEDCEPGDLAFFENDKGRVIHVGIILENQKIIHASGQVRIDTLDTKGIFNKDRDLYSHKLHTLKRIL